MSETNKEEINTVVESSSKSKRSLEKRLKRITNKIIWKKKSHLNKISEFSLKNNLVLKYCLKNTSLEISFGKW